MTDYSDAVAAEILFKQNLVIDIEGTKFAKYQPDSGLVIDSDKLILSSASINPSQIDLKRAITQIDSASFTIIDGDGLENKGVFSKFIGKSVEALTDKSIKLYLGRITGSFDFSSYQQVAEYNIQDIKKPSSFYNIRATAVTDKTLQPIFDQKGDLGATITDTETSIIAETETDSFPSSGWIRLEDEFIEYSSKVFADPNTTFTVATRGALGSTAVAHDDLGVEVLNVVKVKDNPINILLQMLISSGGGGTYDVLFDGAGIDETLIDVAGFESIRNEFFTGDEFTLYLSNIENMMTYIEKELLRANNVRIIKNAGDNKIGLAILDQSILTSSVPILDKTNTLPKPTWKNTRKEVQNIFKIRYNWVEGIQKFTKSKTVKDDASIIKYGKIKGETLSFKGIQVADNGNSIADDRVNRYLNRFSTPRVEITCKSFMKTSLINAGDKVRFVSSELPQEGGGLGMNSIVEVIQKAINFSTGVVKFKLRFTSYSNLRIGLIAPSPRLDNGIASQKEFNLPTGYGTKYSVGYKCLLWDSLTSSFTVDPINEIESISNDTLVFKDLWATTLLDTHELFFAGYSNCDPDQQARYLFGSLDTNVFSDGTKAFQIIL